MTLKKIETALKQLLDDDGQEFGMYAIRGAGKGKGFYAVVSGDCYVEGFDAESPLAAIAQALSKYAAERDEDAE